MIFFYLKMKSGFDVENLKFHVSTNFIYLTTIKDSVWCYGFARSFRELSFTLFWCMELSHGNIELTTYDMSYMKYEFDLITGKEIVKNED